MQFLVRFVQLHESFRLPELRASAELNHTELTVVQYSTTSPFCIVTLPSAAAARAVVSRLVLCKAVYELWGNGSNYDELHAMNRKECVERCKPYETSSFKFSFDCFGASFSLAEQTHIVESFRYMDMKGPIKMSHADVEFTVFAEYAVHAKEPKHVALGRLVSLGGRDLINTYSLKKRGYLSTTSMDSELALVGANLVLASPGKIIYDPFLGTGSLPLACSHFGALACGSDLDGRAIRGKDGINVRSNFGQYGLQARYLGAFAADLTHCPLRQLSGGWLDAIVCDPPYGVREGLKVLGNRVGKEFDPARLPETPAHLLDNYVPPKKPYSFDKLLRDITQFASDMLVEGGRLSFWMPTANDEAQVLSVPSHPGLELVSNCVQPFNKWSRRLLTYRRLHGDFSHLKIDETALPEIGRTADELNNFRKRYFERFKRDDEAQEDSSG